MFKKYQILKKFKYFQFFESKTSNLTTLLPCLHDFFEQSSSRKFLYKLTEQCWNFQELSNENFKPKIILFTCKNLLETKNSQKSPEQ